jgi:hypothetical protein
MLCSLLEAFPGLFHFVSAEAEMLTWRILAEIDEQGGGGFIFMY